MQSFISSQILTCVLTYLISGVRIL